MGEIAFENRICDMGASLGWANRKMQYIGRRGCPDRWFFRRGELRIAEFKAPQGVLSLTQIREHRRMRKLGFTVWVVLTDEDAEAMFRG